MHGRMAQYAQKPNRELKCLAIRFAAQHSRGAFYDPQNSFLPGQRMYYEGKLEHRRISEYC